MVNIEQIEKMYFDLIEKEKIEDFDKSLTEFIEKTKTEDSLAIIIRGHLYIENALYDVIKSAVKDPKNLNLRYFKDKLNLAKALGLIKDYQFTVLEKINKYRNNYAHNLKYEFSEKDIEDLISILSKSNKELYEKDLKIYITIEHELNTQLKLRVLLGLLWTDIKFGSMYPYLVKKNIYVNMNKDCYGILESCLKKDKIL